MPSRPLRFLLILFAFLGANLASAQGLAGQLYNTVSASQRTLFEVLQASDATFRLSGGYNTLGPFEAVLQDEDYAFGQGEVVAWNLAPSISGQVHLFDIGASGAAQRVSPNAFGPPIEIEAGQARIVPLARDGVTLFVSDKSRTQILLAIIVPPGISFDVPFTGDPRSGTVESGVQGILTSIQGLIDRQTTFEFALTVYGYEIPPLPPEVVEQALTLDRDQFIQVQQALNDKGYDVGLADGIFGRNTRRGVEAWQRDLGLTPTGYLNSYSLGRLLNP